MGTPEFAVPALLKLFAGQYPVVGVVCQPDRPQGRHMEPKAPPVKLSALAHGLPVLQPEKVRTPDFEAAVRSLRPEMIVTAAYGRILPPGILAVPPLGCLNVHASLLPAYRGAAPIQWCLIRGETVTGVTIMKMDEGMDTGDIVLQRAVAISEDIDAGTLGEQLAALGAEMLPEAIEGLLSGRLQPMPQDHALATAITPMTRESGAIGWTADARTIHNLIRGTYPWPGAYTWCQDRRLKVYKARICTDQEILAAAARMTPGTICQCGRQAISVACGSGAVDLLEIQTESGKKMSCCECAHNYRLGQQLGSKVK